MFFALSALVFAAVAYGQAPEPVACTSTMALLQSDRPWVAPLFDICRVAIVETNQFDNPWQSKICVAAAVAATPGLTHDALDCALFASPVLSALPNMPFSVYQSITGSTSDKVFINQQNLIDLIYSQIGLETNPVWPADVSEVIAKIQTVFAWTATGSTIPYSHFSDWLKFAPEPSLPGSTSLSTQFPVSTAVGNATATAFPVSTAVVNATATAFPVSTAVLNATATAFPVTTAIVTATAVTSVATTSA